MNYNQLIRKLLAGTEINALERAELENFDADKIMQERDQVQQEHNQLKNEHASLKRAKRLQEISSLYSCCEPDFLDYLASREQIDLEDKKAVENFISAMQKSNPHCFFSQVKSGGGGIGKDPAAAPDEAHFECDRIGRIAASIAHAPETGLR